MTKGIKEEEIIFVIDSLEKRAVDAEILADNYDKTIDFLCQVISIELEDNPDSFKSVTESTRNILKGVLKKWYPTSGYIKIDETKH